MKKVLTYLIVFIAIGTIITVVSLSFVDNFLYSMSQSNTFISQEDKKSDEDSVMEVSKIKIDEGATNLQYSFNNKYYTYLKDSKVYVNKVSDGQNFSVIEEEEKICYYNLLYDKNLIIYITEEETSKTNNTIYRVDLFNSMSQVKSGTIFDKMIMLQHRDRVYYEDTNNNIYSGSTKLNIFKTDVKMIGIDLDDNIYFLSDDNKSVYKLKDNKIKDTIKLTDSDIVTTYTNNVSTYIIYPTYVIDVSSKNPLKRISRMSEYVKFEAIKDDTMYLRTSDNNLVATKILMDEIDEETNDNDDDKEGN